MIPRLNWATLTIPPAGRLNNAASGADDRQLSAAGSRSVVPLTYGQDRIGGLILNVLPTSAAATTVLVQVLWGFAGHAVADVRLNGEALPAGATVTHYLGSQSAADSALVAAFALQSITYGDTLQGYAYSVLALPGASITAELQVTALVSGRRLYDPRKDGTMAGGSGAHRLNNTATWEWSDNPALALADFLASTVYGAAKPVDWASVMVAANANDATVGSPAEKRRIVGVTFIDATSVQDVAETMRAYAGAFLLPTAAGVRLLPDADDAPVADYMHAAGDIAAITPLQLRDLGNSPTVVEIIYTDTTVVPWRDASAFAELPGAGSTRPYRLSQVRMPGVHRYSQARREAIERLNKLTLQDLTTTIEVFDGGIRHQRGDIVRVTHPIGVAQKLFRVVEIEAPSPGRWVLGLVEHDPACYSSVVETVPVYANSGAFISEAVGGGGDGISSYMIEIYAQAATQPPTPTGGEYTFEGDVFVPPGNAVDPAVDIAYANNTDQGLTVPTHQAGDLLVLFLRGVNSDSATPTLPAGWTNVGTGGNGSNMVRWRLCYRVDANNSIASIATQADNSYGVWVVVFRGAAVGGTAVSAITVANTSDWASLPVAGPRSVVLYGAHWESTTPAITINGSDALIGERGAASSAGSSDWSLWLSDAVTAASWPGNTITFRDNGNNLTTQAHHTWAIELVPALEAEQPIDWSRDQPEGSAIPTWVSRYLVQTDTPAVAVEIPLTDSWSAPNKHVQDGEGGAVLYLTATAQAFTFNGGDVATPTSQTITFTAVAVTLTGTPSFSGTLFDAAGASLGPATLGGSGNTRTLTVTNFGAASRAVVSVTLDGFTDTITVVRLRDGAANIDGYITNESVIVAAAANGTVSSFDNTGGTFRVFAGLTEVTGATVTYSVVSAVAVTISIASSGVYTVTALSADTGSAILRAVFNGITVDKVYSIAKARAGAAGGDAYVLELDNGNVTVPADIDGFVTSYTPARTGMRVIRGGTTDDTANWTLAKSDGAGIASTLTGSTLAVTSLTSDVGAVQITANRTGFAELRARFTVTRARSATAVSGVLSGGYYAFSLDQIPPTAVGVFFEDDGTVKGGDSSIAYPVVGNWYAPTTADIGNTHWIRLVPRSGASALDVGTVNSWLALSAGQLWAYEVPALGSAKAGIFDYEISTSSSGTPVVGSGVIDLFAGAGN